MGLHSYLDTPTPEHQSIFSDTERGIPSPTVPHEHPYPTRYHGPVWTTPRFFLPYREASYQVPSGLPNPNFPTAPCDGCQGNAASGLGADQPALFGTATGSTALDALLGAAIGYASSPKSHERALWAAGGAAAGLLAGTLGLLGVVGAAVYVRKG